MFPSQGYFFSINCPDYIHGRCNRAYCHFIHNEKLLRSSSSSKTTSEDSPLKTQLIPSNITQASNIKCIANQDSNRDNSSDFTSSEPPLNVLPQDVSQQNVVAEVKNSSSANDTSPDLLTQLISEAVKKVLSENTAFNASALDANSLIKSLNTKNIVSKAVKEISSSQSEKNVYDPQPKLYLPPPGTPVYQPTPIKYLMNKNKPNENALPATSQEYNPVAINCDINAESNDDQVTDFSSADEGDDGEARSDFDMLEEVLVEKLSSDPVRSKAIQKRKKALGKSSAIKIPSTSSIWRETSKSVSTVPKTAVSVDKEEDSDSAFLPPSPIFTSSMKTNNDSINPLDEEKPKVSVGSSYNHPCENNVTSDEPCTKDTNETVPGSSTHNLLPQIAELSRPNIKAWTPVAKVESLMSVEKMLEKLDRIDTNKNSLANNLTPYTSGSKDCPALSKPEESQCSNVNDKQHLSPQGEGKLNENESNQVVCTNKDGRSLDEKKTKDKSDSSSREQSIESDVSKKEREKKESQTKKINSTGERSSNRKRSLDSDSHSSGNEHKRRRSSSSSKKKKKHKKRNVSSEDYTSDSEDESYSSEEDAKERRSKKKKKHKKHRSKRSKDRKKRGKRDKSRSRKGKSSRERRSRSISAHDSDGDDNDKRKKIRDRSRSDSVDNSDSSEDKRKTVHKRADSSSADNDGKSSHMKRRRSHQRSRSNSAPDIDSHDNNENKNSERKSSSKSVDNNCSKNKVKNLHEKRSNLASADNNEKSNNTVEHCEIKGHSKSLDNVVRHNNNSRKISRTKLVEGCNNRSSNSSVQEKSNLTSSESNDRQKRDKRTSSHDRPRLNSSDSIGSPKKSKEMPTPISNVTATDSTQVLITPMQIKKEKIDVDVSIVKVEKKSCLTSDSSKISNTQHLSSISRNNSSGTELKDSSLGNVRDKPSEITVKIEKNISSLINKNQPKANNSSSSNKGKTFINKTLINSASSTRVNENISSVSEDSKSCNESLQATQLEKSSSTSSKLVRTNAQSTKSIDMLDPLTESNLSLHKSSDKIPSKRKLENYTSSLLQKVSDSLSSTVRADAECLESDAKSSKDGQKDSKSSNPSKGHSKSKKLTEFSIFENVTEHSRKKHRKSSSSHKEIESSSKSKERIKTVRETSKSNIFSGDQKDKKSSNSHNNSHKQKEEHSSTSKHSSSSTSSHISSTSKGSGLSSQRKREERRPSDSSSSSSKSSKTLVDRHEKHRHHESSKSNRKESTNRTSDSDWRKSKDLKNNGSSGIKKKDPGKGNKENSKPSSSVKDDTEAGSDSPIPDLSALDELPKEDWDQLLSTSSNLENSDSDEGVDVNPSFDADYDIDNDDTDDINDPKVLEECMKVFSEYNPEKDSHAVVAVKEPQKQNIEEDANEVVPSRKSRVAYSGASGNLVAKPKALVKPRRKTPSEIMLERYRKLKEEEAALQKKLEMQRKELERHGRLPHNMAISSSSVSSSTDSVPSSSNTTGKKRIAISSGKVDALLKSKNLLKSFLSSNKSTVTPVAQPQQTLAMTVTKGAKRVAHIPKMETLERPVVSTEEGTKVPQNIRQRYLNCFIDETVKFCDGDAHAFNVALAEETICHKRATTRMVYLNLAVNTVKKLRSSQISEAAQELLDNDPKYQETRHKKISSAIPPSASSKKFEHPVNPNHRTVSHFSVMASGGQKGSWSIQKPKKSLPDNIKEYLTGIKFYKCLKKYVLSVEMIEENCFPRPDPSVKGKAILKKINTRKKISPSEIERYCDRCSVLYEVDTWGLPTGNSSCVYHWGRAYKCRGIGGLDTKYSCCHGDGQSEGCCIGTTHVSENFSPNFLTGYVRTIPKSPASNGDYGVYALDCEMCYTTAGSELTRITVTDSNCKSVYETLVKPENPIIDYNTRFSGITENDLEGVTVKLRDVQAALLTRFSEKTILMGHSLESDFSALKIIHDTVVDTSVVFPHKLGAPYKRALRNLASEYLSKIIQNEEGGHDSAEDANTCMELMHWKVKEDFKLSL